MNTPDDDGCKTPEDGSEYKQGDEEEGLHEWEKRELGYIGSKTHLIGPTDLFDNGFLNTSHGMKSTQWVSIYIIVDFFKISTLYCFFGILLTEHPAILEHLEEKVFNTSGVGISALEVGERGEIVVKERGIGYPLRMEERGAPKTGENIGKALIIKVLRMNYALDLHGFHGIFPRLGRDEALENTPVIDGRNTLLFIRPNSDLSEVPSKEVVEKLRVSDMGFFEDYGFGCKHRKFFIVRLLYRQRPRN